MKNLSFYNPPKQTRRQAWHDFWESFIKEPDWAGILPWVFLIFSFGVYASF